MKYYVIEIDYHSWTLRYTRSILLHTFDNKEEAENKLKEYSEYTGPHFCIIVELSDIKDTNEYILKFGKFKETKLKYVPNDYVIWMYMNVTKDDYIKSQLVLNSIAEREYTDICNKCSKLRRASQRIQEQEEREYYKTHRFELM